MGKLIDAEALGRRFRNYQRDCEEQDDTIAAQIFSDCVDEIADAPAIDAVEVVHCGQCDQWHNGACSTFVCDTCGPDFYCANGHRKDGAK